MRKLILALALLGVSVIHAQSFKEIKEKKEKAENDEKYFDKDDKDFNITEVPEKWKNKSAVILCEKNSFSYFKKSFPTGDYAEYKVEETVRKRIKLQDNAAVKEFSEFHFSAGANVGLHVIKPSGKVEDIDLSKAVSGGNITIPGIFRSYVVQNYYRKLAIPGLEAGDIIDYYYSDESFESEKKNKDYPFTESQFVLNSQYNTVKKIIYFNIEKGFFLNFNTYNTTAKLVQGDAGVNRNGRTRDNIKTFALEISDLEKAPDEKWVYGFRHYPTVKFQVVAGQKNAWKDSEFFLGTQDQPKSTTTRNEIITRMSRVFLSVNDDADFVGKRVIGKFMIKYLQEMFSGEGEKDPEAVMKAAYYCFRYYYAGMRVDYPITFSRASLYNYMNNLSYADDRMFCEAMKDVAKKFNIPLEVFIAVPRSTGTFNEVLIPSDIKMGILVNKSLLLSAPRYYSTPSTIAPTIEGTTGWVFSPEKDSSKIVVREFDIPPSTAKKNTLYYKISASVDQELENIGIQRTRSWEGQLKDRIPAYLLFPYQEEKLEHDVYSTKNRNSLLPEEEAKLDALGPDYKQKANELFKQETANEFELKGNYEYEIVKKGRDQNEEPFEIKDFFDIQNTINKTGNKYMLNLGSLIGKQVEIAGDKKNRETDIDIDYAQMIIYEINIILPEGYTLENLDDFNVNVDNASMSFTSTAKFEGNTIQVVVKKEYKVNHDKKENWKNWTDVLDAAFNYSQKKVVLKKV